MSIRSHQVTSVPADQNTLLVILALPLPATADCPCDYT